MNGIFLSDPISESFNNLFAGVIAFVPNLIVAVVIFIVGWLIGVGVGRVIAQLINALRVDQALKATGMEQALARAGIKLSAGNFIGGLVKWFFIVVFMVAALQIIGLSDVNTFLKGPVLNYIPKVIIAVLMLLVGTVVADAMRRVVEGSAKAASLHSAGFLGKVTQYSIWAFVVLMALSEMEIAAGFIQTFFTGIIIAASLAIGLAFGLGGQKAAERYIDRLSAEIRD